MSLSGLTGQAELKQSQCLTSVYVVGILFYINKTVGWSDSKPVYYSFQQLKAHHPLVGFLQTGMEVLPQELLLHIFDIAQSERTSDPTVILTLSQVCSRWHEVALSSGQLWTRIFLAHPIYSGYLLYIGLCLERSQHHPLDIVFDFRDPAWNWDEDTHSFTGQEMGPIMRLFLTHVMRWQNVELLSDTWAPIFTFLRHTRDVKRAPLLRTISLTRCNLYYAAQGNAFQPESLREPIALFGGLALPSLTSVSLTGTHIDWNTPFSSSLSELELKFLAHDVMPSLSQFRAMCLASPSLSRLTLAGCGPSLDADGKAQVHLKYLERFSFGFCDIPYSLQLLSLFDFPSLVELVLEDVSRVVSPGDPQEATALVDWFCTQQQPGYSLPLHQLRRFEIHHVQCSAPAFGKMLGRMAALTSMELSCVAPELLSLLTWGNDAERLCPHLAELYCQDMDPDVLLIVVSSRRLAVGLLSPLRKAVLDYVRQTSPSSGSMVYKQLVGLGVTIQGIDGSETSDS